jgi:hypothetical protein
MTALAAGDLSGKILSAIEIVVARQRAGRVMRAVTTEALVVALERALHEAAAPEKLLGLSRRNYEVLLVLLSADAPMVSGDIYTKVFTNWKAELLPSRLPSIRAIMSSYVRNIREALSKYFDLEVDLHGSNVGFYITPQDRDLIRRALFGESHAD